MHVHLIVTLAEIRFSRCSLFHEKLSWLIAIGVKNFLVVTIYSCAHRCNAILVTWIHLVINLWTLYTAPLTNTCSFGRRGGLVLLLGDAGRFLGFDRLLARCLWILPFLLFAHIFMCLLVLQLFRVDKRLNLGHCTLRWLGLLFTIRFARHIHILRIVHVYFVELLIMLLKTAIRTLLIVINLLLLRLIL